MSFYRFGHLSRKKTSKIKRVLNKKLSVDVESVLEDTNGGRFDCNCEHPIYVNDLNAEIQINVLYGLRKNKRENIYYWNYKYGHQIPEDAVIIGDTWDHGFIVYIYDRKEDGIYYWDASYNFECSNEAANAYYIADSMGRLLDAANVDSDEDIDIEFLSASERFSLWKKRVYWYLSCRKMLREFDKDFLQQKRHKSNMLKKRRGTYAYYMKCKSRKYIEEFGELIGYEFSEFFKKYAVDNESERIGERYCLSENGFKVCFGGLLGLAQNLRMSIRYVNLSKYRGIGNSNKLSKDFIIIAYSEENYIAIKKSDNSIVLLDSEGLFIDKIADDFEGFLASLCDEEEIKEREREFKSAKGTIDILEFLKTLDNVEGEKELPTMEEIRQAEEKLGVKFADDYVKVLLNYGKLSVLSTELMGLSKVDTSSQEAINFNNNYDVVYQTLFLRELECHEHVPSNMYVIQDLHIECFLLWQDETGAVYATLPWSGPKKEADSLAEYIKICYDEDVEYRKNK